MPNLGPLEIGLVALLVLAIVAMPSRSCPSLDDRSRAPPGRADLRVRSQWKCHARQPPWGPASVSRGRSDEARISQMRVQRVRADA